MDCVLEQIKGGEDWHKMPANSPIAFEKGNNLEAKYNVYEPIVKVTRLTDWQLVVDEARRTAWKDSLGHEPSHQFKMNILMSRHSPIQALIFRIEMKDVPSWVSVHYVRHHVGIAGHWVSSQRPDRSPTGANRHSLPQDALVNHDIILNAQEIMFISRKRLCMQASAETRAVWRKVVEELKKIGEPELAAFCQPECWWCGGCTESNSCGAMPPKPMPTIG